MVSILICSIQPSLFVALKDNISNTIGVPHEILVFDNRIEKKSICSAYNYLAKLAKYDLLCFLHEDVIFTSVNWGKTLINIFERDTKVGAIGVAGSKYKSAAFSGWYTGVQELDCANIIHRDKGNDQKIMLRPSSVVDNEEVVCLDGVFIASLKTVWEDVRFDEENLTHFHFYDIDYSVRASIRYKVVVTYEIDLIHITKGGDFGNKWVEVAIVFHQLKRDLLPLKTKEIGNNYEKIISKTYLDVLKNYHISTKNKKRWIQLQGLNRQSDFVYDIAKFLLYKPLRLKAAHNILKKL